MWQQLEKLLQQLLKDCMAFPWQVGGVMSLMTARPHLQHAVPLSRTTTDRAKQGSSLWEGTSKLLASCWRTSLPSVFFRVSSLQLSHLISVLTQSRTKLSRRVINVVLTTVFLSNQLWKFKWHFQITVVNVLRASTEDSPWSSLPYRRLKAGKWI